MGLPLGADERRILLASSPAELSVNQLELGVKSLHQSADQA
jgi:hypothetical protein